MCFLRVCFFLSLSQESEGEAEAARKTEENGGGEGEEGTRPSLPVLSPRNLKKNSS